MTKGELISQVLLNVTGGQPTQDSNVKRADIENYIESAINYALVESIREARVIARSEGDITQPYVSSDYLKVYQCLDVSFDEKRDLKYLDLPFELISLHNNAALGNVWSVKGNIVLRKALSQAHLFGIGEIGNTVFYWHEKIDDKDRLWFNTKNPYLQQVNVSAVPSIKDLDREDLIPMPSGREVRVMDLAIDFFRRQRFGMADNLNNNVDDGNSK